MPKKWATLKSPKFLLQLTIGIPAELSSPPTVCLKIGIIAKPSRAKDYHHNKTQLNG